MSWSIVSSPTRIVAESADTGAPSLPTARRSRASISAGPAVASTRSSMPQSADSAIRPASVTTASIGMPEPVACSIRHVARASARSVRASIITTFGDGPDMRVRMSRAAVRTTCGSRSRAGNTAAAEPPGVAVNIKISTRTPVCVQPTSLAGEQDLRVAEELRIEPEALTWWAPRNTRMACRRRLRHRMPLLTWADGAGVKIVASSPA